MSQKKQDGEYRAIDAERIVDVDVYISTDMDAADVQTEIDALAADGGGTIVWKRGTHTYSQNTTVNGIGAAIELKSNIDYLGRGYATHIVQGEKDINVFATEYDDTATDNQSAGNVEYIRIGNIRLDGNKGSFSNFSTAQTNNVVWSPLARNVMLEKLWVRNVHQHGLHPDAVIDSTIRDCDIQDIDGQGIHAASRTLNGTSYGPYNLTIDNVRVTNTGTNGISGGGDETEDLTVSNCNVENIGAAGITLQGRRLNITDNHVEDCATGITIGSTASGNASANASIGDNTAENCTWRGIKIASVNGCSVVGNATESCNYGLVIEDSTPRPEYINIAAHMSTGSSTHPVWVRDGVDISLDGVMGDAGDGTSFAVYIDTPVDGATLNNCVGKNAATGIRSDAAGTVFGGCVARDNTDDGIFANADDVTIDGCRVYNNGRHGFRCVQSDARIYDPIGSGNGGDFIRDNGTRTKVNNIIGGGPLGGVIASTVTGASTGDELIHNGNTDSGAYEGERYYLKANGDWQSQADSTRSFTPS